MQLETFLEKCEREQWRVGDLDWSRRPRELSREDEIAIVQYFTDMAGIERLAAALFAEQEKKVTDPVLRRIFATFVQDEIRHSHVAQMLADFYDVHRYRAYELNPALRKFTPHFVNLIRHVSPDIANAYVTSGELILDVALLRSLNDHVADEMADEAMDKINRDESRHIAVDFRMIEHYASPEYAAELRARPKPNLVETARAAWCLANVFYHAGPFFKAVFFRPMERLDPTGRRMRQAFTRIQLIGEKPNVQKNPLVKSLRWIQDVYDGHPVVRVVFGRLLARIVGVDESVMVRLGTESERRRARAMSFEAMAEEALALKHAT